MSPHAAAFESRWRCVWCTKNDVALARERPYLVPSRACLPRERRACTLESAARSSPCPRGLDDERHDARTLRDRIGVLADSASNPAAPGLVVERLVPVAALAANTEDADAEGLIGVAVGVQVAVACGRAAVLVGAAPLLLSRLGELFTSLKSSSVGEAVWTISVDYAKADGHEANTK